MPTLADSKSIAMSGASPERIAATIFVVSMFPETSTLTSGCFASYSAIARFMTPSSRAVNGSQTFRFTGLAGRGQPDGRRSRGCEYGDEGEQREPSHASLLWA